MNQVEKLRTLIRESINEYIRKIDEAGSIAAFEAKELKCEEAINERKSKIARIDENEDLKEMVDETKIKELQNEIKILEKAKKKYAAQKAKLEAKKDKKSAPKEDKKVTTDAPVDEADVTAEMDMGNEVKETAINESFLKMQKLAGLITESQYKKKINKNTPDDYTPPAYEAINDLMDAINMNTEMKGDIVPYRSIKWLDDASDADGNMDMLVYKKEKYEIAIGADDVYQDTDDPDSIMWIIQSNDPNVDFGEHMTFDEAENAATEWLKS